MMAWCDISQWSRPWVVAIGILGGALMLAGMAAGLWIVPADYLQGDLFRILYVHVPAAWVALGAYLVMAFYSLWAVGWKSPRAFLHAQALAPLGMICACVTLVTGSIWGYYAWGAWWVWDARLTSMLILTLFYLSYILVDHALRYSPIKMQACSMLAIIGAINVPIVKFSVTLWNSLHQPASVIRMGGPRIHSSMIWPLFLVFAGLCCFLLTLLYFRVTTLRMKARTRRYSSE